MAQAAAHDKKVEYLVSTEAGVKLIKYRELQSVDHTTDRIDHTAGEEPAESL